MFAGRKYVRQLTRGIRDPVYTLTREYREFIKEQPPEVQLELMNRALEYITALNKKYYVKHFNHLPYFSYSYDDIMRDLPYNTSTHRQKYYY